ncbi:MAG: tetratricopeptide repeat protein [Candidatus Latescibacteria bacterium]|nr:tetratricopeptide repeat protein [Candidatus Latescibacterota bacterium]
MKKKKPVTAQDYIEVGQFYLLNQKYAEAIKQFKKALELKPDAQVYYQLGLAYEASNETTSAQDMYRKALTLDSKLVEAAEHLKKIST